MAEVIIYSTSTCPYCEMAKEFFKKHKVKYTEFNVGEDHDKAREMIEKSGQQGVPVIDIGGQIVIGFDKEALMKALGIEE
ncbi:MAG TPA: glutaredoxin family protein [archaeon]|nr:glutaredoxin family protein [archaeon]